jgi:hypothetical protein
VREKPVAGILLELFQPRLQCRQHYLSGVGLYDVLEFLRVILQVKELIFPRALLLGVVFVVFRPDSRHAWYRDREDREMLVKKRITAGACL